MDTRLDVLKQYNEQHTYSLYPVTTEAQMCVTLEFEANAV